MIQEPHNMSIMALSNEDLEAFRHSVHVMVAKTRQTQATKVYGVREMKEIFFANSPKRSPATLRVGGGLS